MKILKYILFPLTTLISIGLLFTLFLTIIDAILLLPIWLFIVIVIILSSLIFTALSFILNSIIKLLWKLSPQYQYSLIGTILILLFIIFNTLFIVWSGDRYMILGKVFISAFFLFLTFDIYHISSVWSGRQKAMIQGKK